MGTLEFRSQVSILSIILTLVDFNRYINLFGILGLTRRHGVPIYIVRNKVKEEVGSVLL